MAGNWQHLYQESSMDEQDSSATLSDQSSAEGGNVDVEPSPTEASPKENIDTEASTQGTDAEAAAKAEEEAENLFTDPKDLPDELKPHFKRMQA